MKTWCSGIAVVVMVLVATSVLGEGTGSVDNFGSFLQSSMQSACDGSNASDVCVLDSKTANSVICIHSEVTNGITKLKYFAHTAHCTTFNGKTFFQESWCQDGHTIGNQGFMCSPGDTCENGMCVHKDDTGVVTNYPNNGSGVAGYFETYGSTDAVSCSKQDNALQNICNTVANNKGLETQFPNVWSRLKYYGGCK